MAMVGAGRPSVSAPFTVGPGVPIPFAPAESPSRTWLPRSNPGINQPSGPGIIEKPARPRTDQMFYENYACGSDRNYTGFCDKEVDALIDRQSAEPNAEKRRQLVWEIERRLARDASRPIIFQSGGKWANSVVQCVGPGFAQLLYGDAFRIVVLAALMFAISSWPALLP
jgi:ABC-type transport system substrate-binding protein